MESLQSREITSYVYLRKKSLSLLRIIRFTMLHMTQACRNIAKLELYTTKFKSPETRFVMTYLLILTWNLQSVLHQESVPWDGCSLLYLHQLMD